MHVQLKILCTGLMATGLLAANLAAAEDSQPTKDAKHEGREVVQSVKDDVRESVLNSQVRMALLKSLKGADALRVGVSVEGTTAILSGEVEDAASVKLATEAAKSVEGVTQVRSTITLNPKAPHQENMEGRVKDAMVVADVKLRLLQEVGRTANDIHVTATNGVVSLRGNVPDARTRERALRKAQGTANVQRVEDLMTVKP